jgi:hypothetical protein
VRAIGTATVSVVFHGATPVKIPAIVRNRRPVLIGVTAVRSA